MSTRSFGMEQRTDRGLTRRHRRENAWMELVIQPSFSLSLHFSCLEWYYYYLFRLPPDKWYWKFRIKTNETTYIENDKQGICTSFNKCTINHFVARIQENCVATIYARNMCMKPHPSIKCACLLQWIEHWVNLALLPMNGAFARSGVSIYLTSHLQQNTVPASCYYYYYCCGRDRCCADRSIISCYFSTRTRCTRSIQTTQNSVF